MQVAKPGKRKISRTNKAGNLSLSFIKSSTTPKIKKSTHDNKSSSIAERVSVTFPNAKV